MTDNSELLKQLSILELEEEQDRLEEEAIRLAQRRVARELQKAKLSAQVSATPVVKPTEEECNSAREKAEADRDSNLMVFSTASEELPCEIDAHNERVNAKYNARIEAIASGTFKLSDTYEPVRFTYDFDYRNGISTPGVPVSKPLSERIASAGKSIRERQADELEARGEGGIANNIRQSIKNQENIANKVETEVRPRMNARQEAIDALATEDEDDTDDTEDSEDEDVPLSKNELALGNLYKPLKQLQSRIRNGAKSFKSTTIADAVVSLILAQGTMLIGYGGNGFKYDPEKALWVRCHAEQLGNDFEGVLNRFLLQLYCLRPVIDDYTYSVEDYNALVEKVIDLSTADNFGPRLFTRIRSIRMFDVSLNRIKKLDQTPDWFPVGMDVVNPKTGEIRPRVKEDYFTRTVVTVELCDVSEGNEFVDLVLNQIFSFDREKKMYFLGRLGLALGGSNSRNIIHGYGVGLNAKSFVYDLLAAILGDWFFLWNGKCFVKVRGKDADAHNASQIGIELSRIVRIAEPELGNIDESVYKMLAGQKTRIIRGCGGDRQEIPQIFSAFIDTNSLIKTTSTPVWDRTKIVKFNARFVPESEYEEGVPDLYIADDTIGVRMAQKKNSDYFFSLILSYANELYEKGATYIPKCVIKDTAEARGEIDYCQQFIDACVIKLKTPVATKDAITGNALYEAFVAWYTATHGPCYITMTKFGTQIVGKGIKRITSNGAKYPGIELRTP